MKYSAVTETLSERVSRYKREVAPYHEYYRNWHDHFAWLPVPISTTEKVWLELVERKYTWGSDVVKVVYDPIYRRKSKDK